MINTIAGGVSIANGVGNRWRKEGKVLLASIS